MFRLLLAIAVAAGLAAGAARAQDPAAVPPKAVVLPDATGEAGRVAEARRQLLFRQMLARPDDLDAAFEYAALSVQVGDLEAAVATLERMLIFSPGLPRLQLELGVLYYRLGAPETARTYFDAALAASPPPEVREKVAEYITLIDAAAETTTFSGEVRFGLRYQTNANSAPGESLISLPSLPFPVTITSDEADFNLYGLGLFSLSYDLQNQGDRFEIGLVTYGAKQFEVNELDTALAELTIGPAFDLGRFGFDDAALGVYGIASGVLLDDAAYSSALGAGTRLYVRPGSRSSASLRLEYRRRFYNDTSDRPRSSDRDGNSYRGQAAVSYLLTPSIAVNAAAGLERETAAEPYLESWETSGSVGAAFSLPSPFGGAPLTLAVAGGALWRVYDDPDPFIDPFNEEEDVESFVRGSLTVPVRNRWSVIGETEFRNVESNYPTRDLDNLSVTLSLGKSW